MPCTHGQIKRCLFSAGIFFLFQHIEAKIKWLPFYRQHFQMYFLEWKVWIPIKISLKFVPKGSIKNISALVQIMAWCRPGNKPLSEPMMVRLMTIICITWHQWVRDTVPCTWCIPSGMKTILHCQYPLVSASSAASWMPLGLSPGDWWDPEMMVSCKLYQKYE